MNKVFGLLLLLSIVGTGCQKGGRTSSSVSPVVQAVSLLSISVANAADLPTCDADREGQLVYITSTDDFQSCDTGTWTSITSNYSNLDADINQVTTTTSGGWTELIFNHESTDTLADYDNTTGVFTVRQSGKYQITVNSMTASVAWTAGNRCSVGIFINSTEQVATDSDVMPSATGHCAVSTGKAISLSAGDTVKIKFWQNRGSDTDLEVSARAYNSLSILKLR